MKSKTLVLAAAAALIAVMFPELRAHAAVPLSDAEMSAVRGQDGSIAVPLAVSGRAQDSGSLSSALAGALMDPRTAAQLNAAQFAAALAGTGWTPGMLPGYDGQAVTQYKADAPPATFTFGAAQLLAGASGQSYAGPSMGTFTMTNFDARGTTVWTWIHH